MQKRLFLLDAYALIYRSYYAFIKNPRINSKGINTSAIFGFVNTLEELFRVEHPTHLAVAFDPPGPTFRHELFDAYKAQREETPEDIRRSVPVIKDVIRAYNIPLLEVPGYEADDVIGSVAVQAEAAGFETYMMTPDKDFGQLVTDKIFIYKPKFGSTGFEIRGAEEVKARYGLESPGQVKDLLGLMGDASDNIPGCPGVGEKTASKLLKEYGSVEQLLLSTDTLKGALKTKITENAEKIRFSKLLATIRTDAPIKFDEEALLVSEPDTKQLAEIFSELEFRNLAERITGRVARHEEPKQAKTQPSLFDVFEGEDGDDAKYSTLDKSKNREHIYYLIDNEEKISELTEKLNNAEYFAIDTETTSTEPMRSELVGMSFSMHEDTAYYVPVSADRKKTVELLEKFRPSLENPRILKIGQNIKYDYIVLKKYGITMQGEFFDTMVAHYLLQPEQRHNMDYLAEIYLAHKTTKIEELIGKRGKGQLSMRDVPVEEVCEYAAEDADITLRLKRVFEPMIKEQGLEKLFYEIEMPLVKVLADMEYEGVRIDTEVMSEISVGLTRSIEIAEEKIYGMAGEKFNINSSRKVGEILFDKLRIDEKARKTKQGQYSTTEEILVKLAPRHPIVGLILDYRGLRKLLTTYVNALPELINPETGKIHTSYNQTVTATGRLSSSNPNLQNIPIREAAGREIRRAFVPDEGSLFFSADYSQIELRIMAHLSGDEHMTESFRKGEDIHAATASKIYKVPIGEVTPEMRRRAKTANFGIIYGISAFGLAERLNITRTEAKELIDGYFATFPAVKAYMDKSIEVAREKGYVETITGRKRMLPDINSRNSVVRGYAERNAINAPIQGSAADIIKIAMVRIADRFKKEGIKAKMLIQVHDELDFSVPLNEKERVKQIVEEEMSGAYRMNVPLVADTGEGKNWLEAH